MLKIEWRIHYKFYALYYILHKDINQKLLNTTLMPEKNIVIDNGSGVIKAGFAGEN